jgi:hypothetical protein
VSKIHTINLTDAWEGNLTDAREGTQEHGLKRCFGRPTGLTPADRVWLACEWPAVRPGADVRPSEILLNGTSLPALVGGGQRRADVTPLLESRNELVFVDSGTEPWVGRRRLPDELGRVWLEIEAAG